MPATSSIRRILRISTSTTTLTLSCPSKGCGCLSLRYMSVSTSTILQLFSSEPSAQSSCWSHLPVISTQTPLSQVNWVWLQEERVIRIF